MRGGFYPVPTYVYCHSSFSNETLSAVHNGCLTWNGAGKGNLVYRSTSTHNTTEWPCINGKNEITKEYRGYNSIMMTTYNHPLYSDTSGEADIVINVTYPMGTADTSYDTRTLITHELGHLLGLGDMKSGTSNVMYYKRISGERVHNLSADDKAGIAAIY